MNDERLSCTYTRLDNGIHRLVFEKATNRAMDECLQHMAKVYKTHPPGERLLFLFDVRPDGLPPLKYMARESQKFFKRITVQPETRAAYLHDRSALVSMGQTFLSILRLKTHRRFFPGEQEEEAIRWLLEGSTQAALT